MDFTHAITLPGEFESQLNPVDRMTQRQERRVKFTQPLSSPQPTLITKVATGDPREFGFTAEAAKPQ
jgi:hypothetical protein